MDAKEAAHIAEEAKRREREQQEQERLRIREERERGARAYGIPRVWGAIREAAEADRDSVKFYDATPMPDDISPYERYSPQRCAAYDACKLPEVQAELEQAGYRLSWGDEAQGLRYFCTVSWVCRQPGG